MVWLLWRKRKLPAPGPPRSSTESRISVVHLSSLKLWFPCRPSFWVPCLLSGRQVPSCACRAEIPSRRWLPRQCLHSLGGHQCIVQQSQVKHLMVGSFEGLCGGWHADGLGLSLGLQPHRVQPVFMKPPIAGPGCPGPSYSSVPYLG